MAGDRVAVARMGEGRGKEKGSWFTDHGSFLHFEYLRVHGSRTEGQITGFNRLFLGKSVFFIFFFEIRRNRCNGVIVK
jgi:hypothetical protein